VNKVDSPSKKRIKKEKKTSLLKTKEKSNFFGRSERRKRSHLQKEGG